VERGVQCVERLILYCGVARRAQEGLAYLSEQLAEVEGEVTQDQNHHSLHEFIAREQHRHVAELCFLNTRFVKTGSYLAVVSWFKGCLCFFA
jgi:hypothetical protein